MPVKVALMRGNGDGMCSLRAGPSPRPSPVNGRGGVSWRRGHWRACVGASAVAWSVLDGSARFGGGRGIERRQRLVPLLRIGQVELARLPLQVHAQRRARPTSRTARRGVGRWRRAGARPGRCGVAGVQLVEGEGVAGRSGTCAVAWAWPASMRLPIHLGKALRSENRVSSTLTSFISTRASPCSGTGCRHCRRPWSSASRAHHGGSPGIADAHLVQLQFQRLDAVVARAGADAGGCACPRPGRR